MTPWPLLLQRTYSLGIPPDGYTSPLTILLQTVMLLLPPLPASTVAPYARPIVFSSFGFPSPRLHLAGLRDTLTGSPLRPPQLREEARNAIADIPRERVPAPPSLRLE